MSLILNIDTATARASVSLAIDGKVLGDLGNVRSMDHAAWLHSAIKELLQLNDEQQLQNLSAIAVVAGPGSYTGVRVGMATAKGLCYALKIPLLCINTLAVMAHATYATVSPSLLVCPMLDARRMEVFTALYNVAMTALLPPCAMILQENSFFEWLGTNQIVFCGDGSYKWKEMLQHSNAIFKDVLYSPQDIAVMAHDKFTTKEFSDVAYSQPIYLKEFYTHQKK